MKLYLSSQKLGNHTEQLLKMCGDNKDVAVVVNALDDRPLAHRMDRAHQEIVSLQNIGLNPVELDLRDYFGHASELGDFLSTKSLVWIRGGSTFILRRAMIESGFDEVVVPMILDDQLIYGGYSAALLAAGPSLYGTELVDDASSLPVGYSSFPNPTAGLELVDFFLIPHEGADTAWAKNIINHVNLLRSENYHVITLTDGSVYIKNGKEEGVRR